VTAPFDVPIRTPSFGHGGRRVGRNQRFGATRYLLRNTALAD